MGEVDVLDLVVVLQVREQLGGERGLEHVVVQVQSDQLRVVVEQIWEVWLAVGDHVLGEVQVFESRFGIGFAGVGIQDARQIGRSFLRDLVVAKAHVKQARAVADSASEDAHEPVIDATRIHLSLIHI